MTELDNNLEMSRNFSLENKTKLSKKIIKEVFAKDKLIIRLVFITACILIVYFIYYFIIWNVYYSFTDWDGLIITNNFVGFDNYENLFNNYIFWESLKNNLMLMGIFIPCSLVLGLFLAILLDQKIRKQGVFRAIYLLPYALSFVVTAKLWRWMLTGDGVINSIFDLFGLEFLQQAWLSNPDISMISISIALIWQFSGYVMLVFLAAIRSVPKSHIMAAQTDGASGFTMYIRVIIPQIKTSTFTAFVILMIFSLKAFDFIYILTGGGPGYATTILPIYMFERFALSEYAYAATIATTMFLLVMLIVVPYLYITYRKKKED